MTSGQTFFERDDERIALLEAQGRCAEAGPWGTVCTQHAGHHYSHYDGSDDSSWQNDWPDWAPDKGADEDATSPNIDPPKET